MIICLSIELSTKDKMDKLVGLGEYRDYSELVAVAIGNQFLLHNAEPGQVQMGSEPLSSALNSRAESIPTLQEGRNESRKSQAVWATKPTEANIPEIFSIRSGSRRPESFAALPGDAFISGMAIPIDRWIFGQHNKLLPVKANVRALSNLLNGESTQGVALDKASMEIASAAMELGDILRDLDEQSHRSRDESFAVAFPSSDPSNSDKSRLRYASQFVGAMSKDGKMTGLLIDLKLVNHDRQKATRIQLTELGWLFAELPNPILDGDKTRTNEKFSPKECEFLIEHIISSVPSECFAYATTLAAIIEGHDTPERLDQSLRQYLPERSEKPFTDAFLTTQRAGVIARMADLGLVARARNGLNVTYVVTTTGKQFLERSSTCSQ